MNKKTATSIFVRHGVDVTAVTARAIANGLHDRFPHLPKKVLMPAYVSMTLKAMTGHYPDIDAMTDEEIDVIFLAEVSALRIK